MVVTAARKEDIHMDKKNRLFIILCILFIVSTLIGFITPLKIAIAVNALLIIIDTLIQIKKWIASRNPQSEEE